MMNMTNRYFYMSRWCILLIFIATLLGLLPQVLIVYMSVAVHECCHLLVCRILRVPTGYIALMPYGMELKLKSLVPPAKHIVICLAGPAANFVLFFVGCLLAGLDNSYVAFFTGANFILGVFNMFPCMPLDGGEILRCVLSLRFGILNSYRMISAVSYVCGAVLFGAGVIFALYTGGNITILVVALPVFVSIAKMKVTCIYAVRDIVGGCVGGGRLCLTVMPHTAPAARVVRRVSFGYTLVVAVRYPCGEISILTQSELIDAINAKNTYATLGECVEFCKDL